MPHQPESLERIKRLFREIRWVVLAVGVVLLAAWGWKTFSSNSGRGPTRAARATTEQQATVRSCEAWEQQYAVIPSDSFPRDTLRVGRGEQWVVRLHPTEPSGWVIFDPRARHNWTQPTGQAHMLFSDGLRITDAPGKQVERGKRNAFRAWGEGCMLVQASD